MRKKNLYTDTARLALLETATLEAQGTDRTLEVFDADLSTHIQATAEAYRLEMELLRLARNQVKQTRDQLRAHEVGLKRLLRRAFQVVRGRAQEDDLPTAHVTFFGLKQDATYSNAMRKLTNPMQAAKDVLFANAELAAAGVVVLIDPSPEQIQAKIDACQAFDTAFRDALDAERAALAQIRQRRPEIDMLIRRITFEIEAATLGWSDVARRNLMRTYGFKFEPTKATEIIDADNAEVSDDAGRSEDDSSEMPSEVEDPAEPADDTTPASPQLDLNQAA